MKNFTKKIILTVLTGVMMTWIMGFSAQATILGRDTITANTTKISYCGLSTDTVILYKAVNATTNVEWQWAKPGPNSLFADSIVFTGENSGPVWFNSGQTGTIGFQFSIVSPLVSPNLQDYTACGTYQYTLTGGSQAFTTYLWSTGATTASITVTTAGTYFVDDSNACGAISDTAVVSEDHSNDASLGSDIATCGGTSLVLTTGNSNIATYLWSTGATTATLTVNNSGTYSVLTNDSNGCVSRDTVIVTMTSPFAAPQICMANFNIPTQKNEVIWVAQSGLGVNRIIVYKEKGTNNWVALDTLSNTGSYVDSTSNPQSSSDSYKIAVEDTCNNVGAMSTSHTTINLIVSYDPGTNTTGLIWSNYLGMPGPIIYYRINGIDTGGVVTSIDSVNGNITSYNYVNPDPKFVKYFISFSASCGNWKTGGNYEAMSNITQFMDITVNVSKPTVNEAKPVILMINNQVIIHGRFLNGVVTDILGRNMHQFTEERFSLPTGVYIITLFTSNNGVIHTKVVAMN